MNSWNRECVFFIYGLETFESRLYRHYFGDIIENTKIDNFLILETK
jgi:hypothetical protein